MFGRRGNEGFGKSGGPAGHPPQALGAQQAGPVRRAVAEVKARVAQLVVEAGDETAGRVHRPRQGPRLEHDRRSMRVVRRRAMPHGERLGHDLLGEERGLLQPQRLQDELAGTENRIAVARRDYNDAVREYNTLIRRFPTAITAKVIGAEEREYFEVTNPSSREVPQVEFDPPAKGQD